MGSYLRLGIEHILSGWDHLAFLVLLIVVAQRLREVALLVTGFTVGHSVTLAAAALGIVVPYARAVEATIAASILKGCERCISYHVRSAIAAGATPDEMIEAGFVAVIMDGGPSLAHLGVLLDAIEAHRTEDE